MPRRKMTDEEKKAFGEKMKKAREAKANAEGPKEEAATVPEEPTTSNNDQTIDELRRMVLELKAQNDAFLAGAASVTGGSTGAQVSNGKVIGTTEKYPILKNLYEDPRPRLFEEPRLKRIAFESNYELNFEVSTASYPTKDGINMIEPKFKLQLVQVVLDDNGEPTNKRVGKAQIIFFEDPETALKVAEQYGLEVDTENEQKFLNDMRYIRVRDWLFDCFWPKGINAEQKNKRPVVIGGQVVDTWEVSTENSGAKIPFDQLDNKLKA